MWESFKRFIVGVVRNTAQGIAGTLVAVIGFTGDLMDWPVPRWVWVAVATGLFAWAIFRTYHEARSAPETLAGDALIGKWFHTFNDDGEVRHQGKVVERQGDTYLAQLFSFMDGAPTTRRFLTNDEVAKAAFYETNREMREEYLRRNPELSRD
jgi:hypothetical protein